MTQKKWGILGKTKATFDSEKVLKADTMHSTKSSEATTVETSKRLEDSILPSTVISSQRPIVID